MIHRLAVAATVVAVTIFAAAAAWVDHVLYTERQNR